MKNIVFLIVLISFGCTKEKGANQNALAINDQVVEASCGQCQFGLEGEGCDLAVRIDGEAYWVDGTGLNDHGDAHAHDGFCEAIRQAKVTGKIEEGRFLASSFELVD